MKQVSLPSHLAVQYRGLLGDHKDQEDLVHPKVKQTGMFSSVVFVEQLFGVQGCNGSSVTNSKAYYTDPVLSYL